MRTTKKAKIVIPFHWRIPAFHLNPELCSRQKGIGHQPSRRGFELLQEGRGHGPGISNAPSPCPPARALPAGSASAGWLLSAEKTWKSALASVTQLLTRGKFRTTVCTALPDPWSPFGVTTSPPSSTHQRPLHRGLPEMTPPPREAPPLPARWLPLQTRFCTATQGVPVYHDFSGSCL